jgi:hypothetical protein
MRGLLEALAGHRFGTKSNISNKSLIPMQKTTMTNEEFLNNYKVEGYDVRECDDPRITQLFTKNKRQERGWRMVIERFFQPKIDEWLFEVELHKQKKDGRDLLYYAAQEIPSDTPSENRFMFVIWFRWHAISNAVSILPLMYAYRVEDAKFARIYVAQLWDENADKSPVPPAQTKN